MNEVSVWGWHISFPASFIPLRYCVRLDLMDVGGTLYAVLWFSLSLVNTHSLTLTITIFLCFSHSLIHPLPLPLTHSPPPPWVLSLPFSPCLPPSFPYTSWLSICTPIFGFGRVIGETNITVVFTCVICGRLLSVRVATPLTRLIGLVWYGREERSPPLSPETAPTYGWHVCVWWGECLPAVMYRQNVAKYSHYWLFSGRHGNGSPGMATSVPYIGM